MKKNKLLYQIICNNYMSHFCELTVVIICELIVVAISYAGAVGYQMFLNSHSSEMFMQEDGISKMFVSAAVIMLFCGVILLIIVLSMYLGKRIPEYIFFRRMGITNSDLKKIIIFETGISYVIALGLGYILGKMLAYGLKILLVKTLNITFQLGKISLLTFPLVCIFTLSIYVLGFLLVKELESDFRIITNRQETTRKEKMLGKFPKIKIIAGLFMCLYTVTAYSKLYHSENVLMIVFFFIGLYMFVRNLAGVFLVWIRNCKSAKYYENLMKNHRLYYRPNTIFRYILFYSMISFLVCFYFGNQAITVINADKPESLYPYDFVCIADNNDDDFFEELEEEYQISIMEYPMIRVANADKTERAEGIGEFKIQGQQIGISESTYHKLKKLNDKSYKKKNLGLDEEGNNVYLVHQQDTATKAQPIDWYYGKKNPNLHVGVVSEWYDEGNKNNTYYERTIVGEEINSLIGCFSTPKCENIVVFSDEYFKKAQNEWKKIDAFTSFPKDIYQSYYGKEGITYIQGPTKLVLMKTESKNIAEIDKKMESLEERHKYVGNYDSTVCFHYSSRRAIKDLTTERAVKMLICVYIMVILMFIDIILLYTMCQMERKEKKEREFFLTYMGMPCAERKTMNQRELYIFFVVPIFILIITTLLFFRSMCLARLFSRLLMNDCAKDQILLMGIYILLKAFCFAIVSKMVRKGIKTDD